MIQIGFFSGNQMTVNLPHRLNQEISIPLLVRATVEVLQLGMQIGESRCQVHAEPVQDGKVGHVDAVHVAGDCGRLDVGGVVVADVNHPVALMLVGSQHLGLQSHVVGQQGKGSFHTIRNGRLDAASEHYQRLESICHRVSQTTRLKKEILAPSA